MLPSDSDDEAPSGGYYIMESASLPRVFSPISPPTNSMEAGLFPPKPVKRTSQTKQRAPPLVEVMEPSDSDEEAPPGGYEVRSSDPKLRAEYLSRARSKSNAHPPSLSPVLSRNSEGSGLSRRKTLPTKRVGERVPRVKKNVVEAP